MALAKRDEGKKVNSEINVTPMVDVMLVLLIIFMVVTPMLQKGISVDMAKVNNPSPMEDADKEDALLVSITRDGKVYFGSEQIQNVGGLTHRACSPIREKQLQTPRQRRELPDKGSQGNKGERSWEWELARAADKARILTLPRSSMYCWYC